MLLIEIEETVYSLEFFFTATYVFKKSSFFEKLRYYRKNEHEKAHYLICSFFSSGNFETGLQAKIIMALNCKTKQTNKK